MIVFNPTPSPARRHGHPHQATERGESNPAASALPDSLDTSPIKPARNAASPLPQAEAVPRQIANTGAPPSNGLSLGAQDEDMSRQLGDLLHHQPWSGPGVVRGANHVTREEQPGLARTNAMDIDSEAGEQASDAAGLAEALKEAEVGSVYTDGRSPAPESTKLPAPGVAGAQRLDASPTNAWAGGPPTFPSGSAGETHSSQQADKAASRPMSRTADMLLETQEQLAKQEPAMSSGVFSQSYALAGLN